jgi:molybdopterin molybdotransferase
MITSPRQYNMLPIKEAENIIFNLVSHLNRQPQIETVNLSDSLGRILAHSISSKLDFPHWDNSAMDGYAVIYDDVKNASTENPINLEIVEEIPAGYVPKITIKSGQTARIFTGALIPDGADTIVIQENTQRNDNFVSILQAPKYQESVRHKGEFYQAGGPLLPAEITINAHEIAVLAAAQCTQIPVFSRPRVAILSTGDELVTPDDQLLPGQLVDSNQYALEAAVLQCGGITVRIGIIKDDKNAIKNAILQAVNTADLVLSTGGVSVGEYDFVEEILGELNAEIHIRSVAIKPGKPLTVASFPSEKVLYFGLPGNPVSALVTFWRFVQPVLKQIAGVKTGFEPKFMKVRSQSLLKSDGKRESYRWGKLALIEGEYQFKLAGGSHSSGNLINLAQTNALAVLPVGIKLINEGEIVQVLMINN